MSYSSHPTMNTPGVFPDQYGQQWWRVEIWIEPRKRIEGKLTKGKRDTVKFFGTEAAVQVFDLEQQRKPGDILVADHNPTVRGVLSKFLDYYRIEVTAGTLADFTRSAKHFLDHFGDLRLSQITNAAVLAYKTRRLSESYKGKPTTKRTINKELSYLSSIIKWAKDEGLCDAGVSIKLFPKKQTKAPIQQTHSFDEVQAILSEVGRPRPNGCGQHAADAFGLVMLMYDAGLRRSEACNINAERVNLPPEPIDLTNGRFYYGTVTVTRKGGKEQQLPILTRRLFDELSARMKRTRSGPLFINPMTGEPYKNIRGGLKGATERAGIDKRITHHLLRHDFVTHLHESGADLKTIQGLAGHADIQTTMDIYSHLEQSTMRDRAGDFAERVDNSPVRNSSTPIKLHVVKKTKKNTV